MLKRIGLSILVGIATGLVFLIAGAFIALVPGIAPAGVVLMQFSWAAGLVAGIVFFVFGRSIWS